ncbi:hypothetical protein [Chitinolyticbacter albus]|uniref:hypothetical protein n=1 Tax=Chitinolyticbacter albus TaxID=2961951 RepID=UPI002109C97D|nr:hypothetical protein [Chitinolyticbacter albus]
MPNYRAKSGGIPKTAFWALLATLLSFPAVAVATFFFLRSESITNGHFLSNYLFLAAPLFLLAMLAFFKRLRRVGLLITLLVMNIFPVLMLWYFNSHPSDDDALAMGLLYPPGAAALAAACLIAWWLVTRFMHCK